MKKFGLLTIVLSLGISNVYANSQDKALLKLAGTPSSVKAGQELYQQVCAACHAKDLSGATGFNLKDGEWIHGEAPSQILSNVKQGFNKAGMPAFGAMFSDKQLQDVVAYIMSEREGLADLTFKIYQMDGVKDRAVTADKLIKSGSLPKNLMDFDMPEIKHYTLEFEGTLYAPDEPSKLHIKAWKLNPTSLYIDGQEVIKDNPDGATWDIKPGKQRIKFRYIVGSDIKQDWKRNLAVFIATDDLAVKLFGISTRSNKIMNETKVLVTAKTKPVVQRKKIHKLPTYSISVGFPEKINYAFNTRSCDVVGLWKGDLLNVGPNIESRGQDGSLVLGDWLINQKDTFAMQNTNKCRYQKMTNKEVPAFFFNQDGVDYKLSTSNMSANGLILNYQVLSKPAKSVTFDLPVNGKVSISSEDGLIKGNTLIMNPNKTSFSITMSAK